MADRGVKVVREVRSVGDLRAFLAACDVMEVPDSADVHARTRLGFSVDGAPLKDLTARPARGEATGATVARG